LPYALAEAVRANPVTLYTTSPCPGCDSGRALLRRKGIPFSEKTVTSKADEARLKELGGEGQLPLLVIGRSKMTGFQVGSWEQALTLASYPERSMLPSNYQYPNPTALTPRQAQPDPDQEAVRVAAEAEAARKAAAPNTPPGFQF
jgi:glutaredoxin